MPTQEDKLAAKALVELELMSDEEAAEYLEAVEEIEPEGGLIGLLVDEGSIAEKDLARVRRKVRKGRAGKTTLRPRDGRKLAKGKTRVRRREAGDEEAEPPPRAVPRGGPREKTKLRKKSSRRDEETAPSGGKSKLVLVAVLALVLVGGGVGAVVVFGGFLGGDDGGGGGSGRNEGGGGGGQDGGGVSDVSDTPSGNTPSNGGGGPSTPKRAPKIPPVTLKFKFQRGMRIIYESDAEVRDRSKDRRMVSQKSVHEFIDCMGALDVNQKVSMERQVTEALTRGDKPTEHMGRNRIDFLVLAPSGMSASDEPGAVTDLLWVLAAPVFPADGKVVNGRWEVERQAREGRFDVKYQIEDLEDPVKTGDGNSRKCIRIAVEARFPGGAPPSTYRIDRAVSTIWFDKKDGVVVKASGFLDTSPSEAEEGAESVVKAKVTRTLLSLDSIDMDQAVDIEFAAKLFFGVVEMVDKRQYAKAQKTVDSAVEESELHAKYLKPENNFIPNLRAMIPEVRMSQQAGAAMRHRKARAYRNIAWRRPERPPAFLILDDAPRRDGKKRTLKALLDKTAPSWIKEHATDGKSCMVYFIVGHLPCSRSATKLANKIVQKKGGATPVIGILLEGGGNRKLFEYIISVGARIMHQIKMDEHMKALTEGKLEGVPAFFVIDASGVVRFAEVGYLGEETQKGILNALK